MIHASAAKEHKQSWLFAVAAILVGLSLGFPNQFFFLPGLVVLYPLGLALFGLGAPSWRQAFLLSFAAASLGHILALSWLTKPLTFVGGLPLAGAIPCMLFVCCALATQAAFFALISYRYWQPQSWRSTLGLGLSWYCLELAYAVCLGFPWLPLAGALAAWPLCVQAADTLGANLVGALWLTAALFVLSSVLTKRWQLCLPGLVLTLSLVGYGAYTLQTTPPRYTVSAQESAHYLPTALTQDKDAFPVLMVEGNIDQNQKWDAAYLDATVTTYLNLTNEAFGRLADKDIASYVERGLILWPETAMPFDLARSELSLHLFDLVRMHKMALATGAPANEYTRIGTMAVYNRLWVIGAHGYPAGSYDKEHLVPFGEYVPSLFRWHFLDALLQEVGAYTPGTQTAPIQTGFLALGPLICYEGIFPWLAQERVHNGANVLVDISNDGWFGDTAAPLQHLLLTSLRAVEQNRWLLRCTNTGISAIYDNRGRIVFSGTQFQAQALWAEAKIESQQSRFHTLFYFLPPFCAVLMVVCLWRRVKD